MPDEICFDHGCQLNMTLKSAAIDLAGQGITILLLHPW